MRSIGKTKALRRTAYGLVIASLLLAFTLFAPVVPTRVGCDLNVGTIFAYEFDVHTTIRPMIIDFPWEVDPRFLPMYAAAIREKIGAPAFVAEDTVYSTLGMRLGAPFEFELRNLAPRFLLNEKALHVLYHKFRFLDLLPYVLAAPIHQEWIARTLVNHEFRQRTILHEDPVNYKIDYRKLAKIGFSGIGCHALQRLIGEEALLWSEDLDTYVKYDPPPPLPPEMQERLDKLLSSQPSSGEAEE